MRPTCDLRRRSRGYLLPDHVFGIMRTHFIALVHICNKLYCLNAIEMTMELLSIEWDEVRFGYFT